MILGERLAENLKQLRAERQLSLSDVAKLSGLSKAMLSDMEKGSSNPTINTLWKLAHAFNVPYTRLLEEQEKTGAIVRGSEVVEQIEEHDKYRAYFYFNVGPNRDFELIRCELDAASIHRTDGHGPNSTEFIYLLSGNLEVQTQHRAFDLVPVDALEFDSSQEHTYVNTGNEPAVFICLNYYPRRNT